ncbi:hypothetical protein BHZ79_29440, partial [Salmonella enterica]|nr:hypothetical protein [Salmonella enterica]
GNISAKGDITLQADNGSVLISGANATATANITSDSGNISVDSRGNTIGSRIENAEFISNSGHITLNASANSGGFEFHSYPIGGLLLYGKLLFKSAAGTTIYATHNLHTTVYSAPAPLVLGGGANLTFDGGAEINARGSYSGIMLAASDFTNATVSHIFVKNGDLTINAMLDGKATTGPTGNAGSSASGGIVFGQGHAPVSLGLDVDTGSNITINADSSANKGYRFSAFAAATPQATIARGKLNGFIFSGEGNINVSGKSGAGDAVNLRLFNNENLTGHLIIEGNSESGIGVNFDKTLKTNVSNASITGHSGSGVGVLVWADSGFANLGNNAITGTSNTGTGINVNGNNVTITHGTLNGTTTSGNGAGVVITGGTNYTIDGANVTGQSANGAGVSVTGNLAVNNNATIIGVSTGLGDGVNVNGSLSSDGGVTIKGDATIGSGVLVDGDTQLNNATVSGNATEGSGIEVKGNLTNANTTLEGNATGHGAGVNIGGNITGGAIKGESASGSGVLVSGTNTTVDGATISGNTSSGVGVNISGNLTNTNGTTVNGSAAEGSGVTLGGNLSGGEVTGTSQTGSGVNITGDNSVA